MHPTVKQLKYLIALDECRHFGKAAEACFISQSAFSVAIKELETTLNVQLVDRTNKSVVMTDAGRAVVRQARLCISDLDALVDIAALQQEPLSGKLTLGVIPTIAPYLLPPFVSMLKQRHPKLQLYLVEGKTEEIHAQLLDGKLDLILIALPYELQNTTIMPLFRDPFLLASRKQSRWIQDDHPDVDALPEESVLLLADGHCLRGHSLAACNIRESDHVNRFAATSLPTLLQMVVADLGVTFVPEMARHCLEAEQSPLQLLPMPEHSYREIGLAWRKSSSRSEEFTLLGELLQELHRQQ